jgi:hypothetical protein
MRADIQNRYKRREIMAGGKAWNNEPAFLRAELISAFGAKENFTKKIELFA